MKIRPYTYTECFIRDVKPKGIICVWLFLPLLIETLTLPIFPLIYLLHKMEICDYVRNENSFDLTP